MKRPRISTLIIAIQFILLLFCVAALGVTLWHNYFLKWRAKEFASEAGFAEATHNFLRGNYSLYKIKLFKFGYGDNDSGIVPTDGTTEPSGKKENQFQIDYLLVNQNFPKVHQEIQQAFVDAYNQHMHHYFDHPEWFDKNGQRIPTSNRKQSANTVNVSH